MSSGIEVSQTHPPLIWKDCGWGKRGIQEERPGGNEGIGELVKTHLPSHDLRNPGKNLVSKLRIYTVQPCVKNQSTRSHTPHCFPLDGFKERIPYDPSQQC